MNIKEACVYLESYIVGAFRPHFLSITSEEHEELQFIHIVICHSSFNHKTITKRIQDIYGLLNHDLPDIMNKFSVIVQAFDQKQMEAYIEELL